LSLTDPLDIAIQRGKGAHEFYSSAAEITKNPNGKKLFIWLAQQEITSFFRIDKH
jgi:rubrerythrin